MRKYLVSASRRTDMLACQPARLVEALAGRLPGTRYLSPERVHTLLISTKDFRNLLDLPDVRDICGNCEQICMNLTITGFGGSRLEPNVPSADVLLKRLPELVELIGDPRRINWCFDPVLQWDDLSNVSVDLFRRLAHPFAAAGIERVMAMFHYEYEHSRITPIVLDSDQRVEFASQIENVCKQLGMDLSFCHVPGFHRHRCVDVERFISLHPTNDATVREHYRRKAQSTSRHCRDMIWDIGWYLPACRMGCLYCYGQSN